MQSVLIGWPTLYTRLHVKLHIPANKVFFTQSPGKDTMSQHSQPVTYVVHKLVAGSVSMDHCRHVHLVDSKFAHNTIVHFLYPKEGSRTLYSYAQ